MKTLSILIPVYFNAESLPLLFDKLIELEKNLLTQQLQLELIFINDGSQDNSWEILNAFKVQRPSLTTIIKLSRNFGAFNAIKAGLNYVTGDCFCYLAADLQDPPELILEMTQQWLNGEKYVICARSTREDPTSSKLFSALYYKLLRYLVIPTYPKNGFDLALMDKSFLPYLKACGKNINLHLFGYFLGFKPYVISYHRQQRITGKSRWTFAKKFNLFLDSILGFSRIFIRLISIIGIIVACAGFIYGVVLVLHAILLGRQVPGFTTLASLIVFLFGLVIILLGVIAEYVWRIYDQTHFIPSAVVDEAIT